MSEPIRTVEELARVANEARSYGQEAAFRATRPDYGLAEHPVAVLAARQARRVIDYLGLDYCQDGETPRECIERRGRLVRVAQELDAEIQEQSRRIAALEAERDHYREALARVARLCRGLV